ncbi:CD63 antigen-like [Anarrhichthys ocellatus]|uniref:CD63 antigen-like n=1 Tax=Anarrhichthys ocellatus TaxID=433405 RepID=UPI0012ECFDC3|nr:CD63 antigen-like [Anarrhichthys ocellatus]
MCTFCSVKCCFVFFNLLFLASGVALIIIGVQEHSTYSLLGAFALQSLSKIAIVLIAVGVAITLVSVLGDLGAFFNNKSMVSCFICILIIIIILEILTGAVFYVFGKRTVLKMKSAIDNKAQTVIHDYSPEKRHAIDKIQEKFRCCGAHGPSDWSSSVGWEDHDAVPDSCCVVKSPECGKDKEKAHAKGCVRAIEIFMLKNLLWVAVVCIGLGVTEVLGIVAGVLFCLNIKRKSYENMS